MNDIFLERGHNHFAQMMITRLLCPEVGPSSLSLVSCQQFATAQCQYRRLFTLHVTPPTGLLQAETLSTVTTGNLEPVADSRQPGQTQWSNRSRNILYRLYYNNLDRGQLADIIVDQKHGRE